MAVKVGREMKISISANVNRLSQYVESDTRPPILTAIGEIRYKLRIVPSNFTYTV